MSHDRAEKVLMSYLTNPASANLALGKIHDYQFIKKIERPHSLLYLYQLNGTTRRKRIYIKLFKNYYKRSESEMDELVRKNFETEKFWYNQFSSVDGFSTFQPLYCSIPLRAIISAESKGNNLARLISNNLAFWRGSNRVAYLESCTFKVGVFLKKFQDFYTGNEKFDLNTLIDDVDIRLKRLTGIPLARFSAKDRESVLQYYQKYLPFAEQFDLQMKYVHSDFSLSNILVNGEELIVHDFNKIGIGHPYFDLTRFYHQLSLLSYKPIFRKKDVLELQNRFLDGYGFQFNQEIVLFHFFLLRHYFTHFIGVAKIKKMPFKSRLYNRWVINQHKKNISQILNHSYSFAQIL